MVNGYKYGQIIYNGKYMCNLIIIYAQILISSAFLQLQRNINEAAADNSARNAASRGR